MSENKSHDSWAKWFKSLGLLATAEVVNATACLVIEERDNWLGQQGSGNEVGGATQIYDEIAGYLRASEPKTWTCIDCGVELSMWMCADGNVRCSPCRKHFWELRERAESLD